MPWGGDVHLAHGWYLNPNLVPELFALASCHAHRSEIQRCHVLFPSDLLDDHAYVNHSRNWDILHVDRLFVMDPRAAHSTHRRRRGAPQFLPLATPPR
jgi:hypothetical protein